MGINKKAEQGLANALKYYKELEFALANDVKVGLLASAVSNGVDILDIGVKHEFGAKRRSFLELPFIVKKNECVRFIDNEFIDVLEGKKQLSIALKRIGIMAENVVDEAFESAGWGQWPDITENTKRRKGSSAILIDTGRLRSSIASTVEKKK